MSECRACRSVEHVEETAHIGATTHYPKANHTTNPSPPLHTSARARPAFKYTTLYYIKPHYIKPDRTIYKPHSSNQPPSNQTPSDQTPSDQTPSNQTTSNQTNTNRLSTTTNTSFCAARPTNHLHKPPYQSPHQSPHPPHAVHRLSNRARRRRGCGYCC